MTDITKCTAKNCKLKEQCYRYTAKDGYWQSYANFNKDKKISSKDQCKDFWRKRGI